MRKRELKNMEWWVLIIAIILCSIGLIALFSATQETEHDAFYKQIIWIGISLFVMVIFTVIDYEAIVKASPIFYIVFLILLVAVLFTKPVNGATSWFDIGFFSLQPSEFAKVFVILFMTYVITKIQAQKRENINKITKLFLILLTVAVPILLIIKEPDYGTAAAFIVATIMMLFTAGIDKKYIISTIIIIAVAIPVLYNYVLPDHAKQRIDVFLNPESDPRGSGYNIIQSKLAIGAGGLVGMGVLKGNQTQLGFLYPKTTDFIFAVVGEEMGFIIACSVILLNILIIVKAVQIAKGIKDEAGAYVAIGIAGIFLFHTLENIGMTMGVLPITGVPLLFVSYGGSSMMTSFVAIGILLNISSQRRNGLFNK